MMTRRTLIVQKWLESERGWGVRPDGYSLHLTDRNLQDFIAEYWARMPNEAPEEYSRPDGAPYTWEAGKKVYEEVKASKNGIRDYGEPPGSGGVDGFVRARF